MTRILFLGIFTSWLNNHQDEIFIPPIPLEMVWLPYALFGVLYFLLGSMIISMAILNLKIVLSLIPKPKFKYRSVQWVIDGIIVIYAFAFANIATLIIPIILISAIAHKARF